METGAFREAHQFQVPVQMVQTHIHTGKLPVEKSFLNWNGEAMALTNMKVKDGGTDRMLRFVNYSGADHMLTIEKDDTFEEIYRSNIIEETLEVLSADEKGEYKIPVRGYEIITLGMK